MVTNEIDVKMKFLRFIVNINRYFIFIVNTNDTKIFIYIIFVNQINKIDKNDMIVVFLKEFKDIIFLIIERFN